MNGTTEKYQLEMAREMGKVAEIVRRHDEVTFPDIIERLTRMESKQNGDILRFVEEREKLDDRIKPLEDDLKERKDNKQFNATEIKSTGWAVIGSLIGVAVTSGWGYLIELIQKIK